MADKKAKLVKVRVTPRASSNELKQLEDGSYTARVTSPPVDGSANQAVTELLSKALKVPKSRIILASGDKSRDKVFRIDE